MIARLSYPSSLELPVPDGGRGVGARIENRTGVIGGLFDSVLKDSDGDGVRDLLNVGLVGSGIRPGDFVRVRFDCRPGQGSPDAGTVRCKPEVADLAGPLAASCSVALEMD